VQLVVLHHHLEEALPHDCKHLVELAARIDPDPNLKFADRALAPEDPLVHEPQPEVDDQHEVLLLHREEQLLLRVVQPRPGLELFDVAVNLDQEVVEEGILGQPLVAQVVHLDVADQHLPRLLVFGILKMLLLLQLLLVGLAPLLLLRALLDQYPIMHFVDFLFVLQNLLDLLLLDSFDFVFVV